MPSMEWEEVARDVTQVAIEAGACSDGDPAEKVGAYYAGICRTLQEIDMQVGNDAMHTSAAFTIAAIRAGLIYAGSETTGFMRNVADGVRATNREVGDAASGRNY